MAKRKSNKYTFAERLAYHLGKVQVGMDNPNSKIAQSYYNGVEKGVQARERAQKPRTPKTLY